MYIIIYDTEDYELHYYGYFSTPERAKLLFWKAYEPSQVKNVKLCKIVENLTDD
jgi:hypothetical protein